MATTIAISGKGGSGKTTLAAMIIRVLHDETKRPVLAVDADPNSCLGRTCGVEPVGTIAEVRERAAQGRPGSSGSDRVRSFEYGIQQAITEANGFDLLTMGRPEGPGCYCAANNLLRMFLDKLSSAYEFMVIDNEAGMEHLSRRTTTNIDLLYIVAEQTPLGLVTAQRIFQLAKQLPISVKEIGVIWNKITDNEKLNAKSLPLTVMGGYTLNAIDTFGYVPYDSTILDVSMQGRTIFDIDKNSPAFSAVRKILEENISPNNFQLAQNSKLKT